MSSVRPTVDVLIFPDVELLDFAGPLEVFTVARDGSETPLFDVRTVAPVRGPFRTRHGLSIASDALLGEAAAGRRADILVVPGGFGVRALLEDDRLITHLRLAHAAGTTVASVCTGGWLLAKAGLLDGREATTHHLCLDRLRDLAPTCVVRPDRRVIDLGSIVTSGGISAGIDMALHLVARTFGIERAIATAQYMEYSWDAAGDGRAGGRIAAERRS